ncbi:TOTE conflict system archaeo-eukaryotic primase domain-containing protein [Odoribacter splanchnicus]
MPDRGARNLVTLPLQGKVRKEENRVFVNENFMVYEYQ